MKFKNLALFSIISIPTAIVLTSVLHPGIAHAEPIIYPSSSSLAGSYTIDAAHSGVSFDIEHMGISKVQGRFNTFSGIVDLNDDVTKSSVKFTIKADSVDTAIAPRDNHLRSKDFFEVETFPEITFVSSSITKGEKGYVAEGTLSMHGKEKKVSIPFKLGGPIEMQGQSRIGVVAEPIVIKRSDFGMSYGLEPQPMIGNDVTVRISLEATK